MTVEKIKLVQGDTKPALVCTITDECDGVAVNITGTTPRLKFRAVGATVLTATLVGTVIDGPNGICTFAWGATTLAVDPGEYEGEIELTYSDATVQSVFEILKFKLRKEF